LEIWIKKLPDFTRYVVNEYKALENCLNNGDIYALEPEEIAEFFGGNTDEFQAMLYRHMHDFTAKYQQILINEGLI
jgi:hypothetical protein